MAATLLFDLDGVLVDSLAATERAWSRWARRVGLEPPEVLEAIHGRRSVDSVRELVPDRDQDEEVLWIGRAELDDTEGVVALPGARELLASLPDERRAVVTSGTRELATKRLHTAGLEPPPTLVCAEDIEAGKPSPDPYLLGAERLGTEPGECIVVEDAPPGVLAGKAAGMTVWAVLTSHAPGELDAADARFPTLVELRRELVRRGLA